MISRTGLLALKALTSLAELEPHEFLGARSLAKQIDAPANYLGKLLQRLIREHLVKSQKGLGGGFRLAKEPSKVSLYEVLAPIEELERWKGCFLGRKKCSSTSPCNAHEGWKNARDPFLEFLQKTMLLDLTDKAIEKEIP
ncbi:Rrf2 family transcriptional regulator [Bdellovibrionota bacterium FG-2]